jgi:hypothetical protein
MGVKENLDNRLSVIDDVRISANGIHIEMGLTNYKGKVVALKAIKT